MATVLSVLSLLTNFPCTSFAQDPGLLARFASFSQLNPSPLYELYWKVTNNRIMFAVRVQTNRWVGFGISPDGLMLDSDVVMGFVDDTINIAFLMVSCCTLVSRPPFCMLVYYVFIIYSETPPNDHLY